MSVADVPPPDAANPLPKDIKSSAETDFLKLIDPYKPVATVHEHDRTSNDCIFGVCLKKTKVSIVALGDTRQIDPEKPPAVGLPVAHIANLGKKVEKYYGLRPQGEADYYLWVDAKSPTQAQWTLLELSHSSHTVIAGKPVDLNYCHKDSTYTGSDADFAEFKHNKCDWKIPEPSPQVSQASVIPAALLAVIQNVFAALAVASTGGGWIACSNGCCT